MTRGFEDITLMFYKSLDTENKFLNPTPDLMLLVISLVTLQMSVVCNIPLILTQYVVRWVGLVGF